MSGTSLDGIDAALIETNGTTITRRGPWLTAPYDKDLRQRLRDALGETGIPLLDESTLQGESRHAALELVDRVMAVPGEITIVALGRLTNLALALSIEPKFAQNVARIVVMGGAVYVPGNVSPVASANLYEDPESAAICLLYTSDADDE